jgi:hypothetical protein
MLVAGIGNSETTNAVTKTAAKTERKDLKLMMLLRQNNQNGVVSARDLAAEWAKVKLSRRTPLLCPRD